MSVLFLETLKLCWDRSGPRPPLRFHWLLIRLEFKVLSLICAITKSHLGVEPLCIGLDYIIRRIRAMGGECSLVKLDVQHNELGLQQTRVRVIYRLIGFAFIC